MEMIRVNHIRVNALEAAVRLFFYDKHIDIYEICKWGIEAPIEYGVNWTAIGTQDVETTISFANDLLKAAKLVYAINSIQMKKVWTASDKFLTTNELFDEAVESLLDTIKYAWAYTDPEEMSYVCNIIKQFVEGGKVED